MPIDTPLAQSQVFAETDAGVPAAFLTPRPHLAGGQAALVRYSESTERETGRLGAYNPAVNATYAWPGRPAGSLIDQTYVKLWIADAVLRYMPLASSGEGVTVVSGYANRVITDETDSLKDNGVSYPRRADLGDRDVTVGDYVKLTAGSDTFETTVQALVADVVAPSIDSTSADAANAVARPCSQLSTAPTVAATGGGAGGGSLAAGTYYIQYTFTGPFGESWGSASHAGATPVSFTISAGNIPRVTLPALPTGATGIRIYLTAAGGAAGTETLYASGITTTTYDMSAAAPGTPGAAVPKSASQTAGTSNNVTAKATATSYRGDVAGDLYEQYTVTVLTGSTGGDATTARLSVMSASGHDDVASVTPAAFGSPTSIGANGLTLTISTSGGHELVAGQTWVVSLHQAWTVPTATGGGTYTGTEVDQTFVYRVVVSRGGRYADATDPQVTVTRTDGLAEVSSPVTVSAATTAYSIGDGLTIQFSSNGGTPGLRKGDVYYVTVLSSGTGAYRTIVTAGDIPAAILGAGTINVMLGIRKTVDVPVSRVSSPPNVNWSVTADDITVKSAIDAYDSTLTDSGTAVAAKVVSGTLYAEYRAWLPGLAGRKLTYTPSATDSATLFAEVGAALGTVDPDNPIAYALWKAAVNSNRNALTYTVIANPGDTDEWQECLDALKNDKGVSALVPLTTDPAVLALYKTHVAERSADEVGGEWRTLWLSPPITTVKAIVTADTTTTGTNALATTADNPAVSGSQYTVLAVPAANAKFVTNGVRAGDVVRYNYTQDAFGETVWDEYTVASVTNEDSLILVSGTVAAVSTPQRVEVWRTLRRSEVATDWLENMTDGTMRHRYVWPPTVEAGGVSVAGYYLAAALAAYSTSIAPHQSLRNLGVSGFDGANLSTVTFNNAQLNLLADAGAVIVTVANDGSLYTSVARTPDRSSVATGEDVVQRSMDAVKYMIYARISQFFGRANLTDATLTLIRSELHAVMSQLRTGFTVLRLGPLVSDITLTSLRAHAVLPDRVVATFAVTQTYPVNEATVTLVL